MSDPTFTQDQPRSLLLPSLLAIVLLALAALLARHFFPSTTVDIAHLHTEVLPNTTVFKSNSIVLAAKETQHTLLVASTIRIDNKRTYPIFLDDFTLTFTDAAGAQLTAKSIQRADLANVETMFLKLKSVATNPLLRDTAIDPGKFTQGTVVFSLPIPESTWNTRKSAEIQVDIYHGHPVYTTIPR